MAKIKGAVVVNNERCKGCDLCVVACPANVLALKPKDVSDVPVAVMFVPTVVLTYIK